jgi:hypothetical protein
VEVPVEVPLTNTEAPGIGAPSVDDVTLPVTVCAMAEALASNSKTMILGRFFFILFGFVNRWFCKKAHYRNNISLLKLLDGSEKSK